MIVREDRPGDKRLVAYVVGGADATRRRCAALKETLPDYMVPTAFVDPGRAAAQPQRQAGPAGRCPRPVAAAERRRRGPAGHPAPSWSSPGSGPSVLGVPDVGVDDDFFDLGGHSLLATQVVARLRTRLAGRGRSVGVMDLFQHPTVRELAALIDRRAGRGPRAAPAAAPAHHAARHGAGR